MTTTADTTTRGTYRAPTARPSFGGVLRSEWIKLTSVRSIVVSLIVGALIMIAFAVLATWAIVATSEPAMPEIPVVQFGTMGIQVTQLVFAIVGVIAITGEYSSGQIRSSLTAVPRRLPMLAAKSAVLGAIAFVVGVLSTLVSAALAALTAVLAGADADTLSFDGAWQALLGSGAYLAMLALFALGAGAIVRNAAGAIAIVLSLLLVVPAVLANIPVDWVQTMAEWQLMFGGLDLVVADLSDGETLWRSIITVLAWPAAALAGGAAVLMRRDA